MAISHLFLNPSSAAADPTGLSAPVRRAEAGMGVVEVLCAIAIIGISMVGSISICTKAMKSLSMVRSSAGVESDLQSIVEGIRNTSYNSLLANYHKSYTSISNGEQATMTAQTAEDRASYVITLEAIKTTAESEPEALKVTVQVTQRTAVMGDMIKTYETMVAKAIS